MKVEKEPEYVELANLHQIMLVWNEVDDAFENLTDEQKTIIMLIQENARLKEEVEALKKGQWYNFRS